MAVFKTQKSAGINHRKTPRVSIGLPVYNGENYLEETLKSILNQNFSDFELIISDNASTDQTSLICERHRRRDARIRYYRQDTNVGAAKNFNTAFQLSRGEYFRWTSHDDLISQDYLEKCVNVLDSSADIILCHTRVNIIHQDDGTISPYNMTLKNVGSSYPSERFGDLVAMHYSRFSYFIFGLIRRDILLKTSLFPGTIGADRILMAELALLGRFHEIPEYAFYLRDHKDRLSKRALLYRHAQWWDTSRHCTRFVFPHWERPFAFLQCLNRVHIHGQERHRCYMKILLSLIKDMYWGMMISDILIAVIPRSREVLWRIKGLLTKACDRKKFFGGNSTRPHVS